jgi:hypothetical protein
VCKYLSLLNACSIDWSFDGVFPVNFASIIFQLINRT